MTTATQNYIAETAAIKGDRALGVGDPDRLGFREVARRIATSLVDRASADGLVVGVEGEWGSGKSSLLYVISEELAALPKDERPTIINFRPWLVGNRDALITSLFGSLSRHLNEIAKNKGQYNQEVRERAKRAGEALSIFAQKLGKAGAVIAVAGEAASIGPIKWLGKALEAIGKAFEGKKSATLSDVKDKLVESLRQLDHRFVITVDDVDRLEPAEVIEVLRLVRSVVDLPNVIYLLCFDGKILAHSIEKAAEIANGHEYLEKIVQLSVFVPKPEPAQLRQWFTEDLKKIASVKSDDELSRLSQVIDYEGGRHLRTPRSVVRALDSMRFYWPPLREAGADLADLVWLQLIKDGNPALYRWIETYCATMSWVSLKLARVEVAERTQETAALMATVSPDHFSDVTYRHYFSEQLPGMSPDYGQDAKGFNIFERVSEFELNLAIKAKRLASPDHYRLYFALSDPSHALTNDLTTRFWAAVEKGPSEAGRALLELDSNSISPSMTKADLLLERIGPQVSELLSEGQGKNLLIAFSNVLDDVYRRHPFDLFWPGNIWDRADKLITPIMRPLNVGSRRAFIETLFKDGSAIGWLTALFRRETFGHGRFGDERRSKDEWFFDNDEFDLIAVIMLERYRAMTIADIFKAPSPKSLLHGWSQGGDPDGPRTLLAPFIGTDEGLVDALEHLVGVIHSSNRGQYEILRRDSLSAFMDYDDAKARIGMLAANEALGDRAQRLLNAFKDGLER